LPMSCPGGAHITLELYDDWEAGQEACGRPRSWNPNPHVYRTGDADCKAFGSQQGNVTWVKVKDEMDKKLDQALEDAKKRAQPVIDAKGSPDWPK
jgi:hypothetical protein